MEKNEMIRKFVGGFLIGGLLLGGGGLALAGSDEAAFSNQASSINPMHGPRMPGMGKINPESMQSVLDSLVADGALTQAQTDAIVAQEKARETERQAQLEKMQSMTQSERQTYRQENNSSAKEDLFTQLVDGGTLTQAQADAIRAAIQTKMQTLRQAELTESLNTLVTLNVITRDQASAIQTQLAELEATRQAQMQAGQGRNAQDRRAGMETMKNMTAAERQTYLEANKPEFVDPLTELVTAGTLTQAQAEQVKQAIPLMQGGKGMHQGSGNGEGGMRGPGPQANACK